MKNVITLSFKIGSIVSIIQILYLFCIGIFVKDINNVSQQTQTILDIYVSILLVLFGYLLWWSHAKYNKNYGVLTFFKGISIGIFSIITFLIYVALYNRIMYKIILNGYLPISHSHLRSFNIEMNILEFILFSMFSFSITTLYFIVSKIRKLC